MRVSLWANLSSFFGQMIYWVKFSLQFLFTWLFVIGNSLKSLISFENSLRFVCVCMCFQTLIYYYLNSVQGLPFQVCGLTKFCLFNLWQIQLYYKPSITQSNHIHSVDMLMWISTCSHQTNFIYGNIKSRLSCINSCSSDIITNKMETK